MSHKAVSAVIIAAMLLSCSAVVYSAVDNDDGKGYSDVTEQFLDICKVPRCSGYEENMGQYLLDFAERYGLEAQIDSVGNVMIDHPGTKGCGIILQVHQDMVPVADEGVVHDFTKDPIEVIIDGDSITANGTTLGADDGTGIAVCLCALKDPKLKDYRFRCIFTVEEETTFNGVNNISTEWLYGFERMVNVDSEQENEITIGCAGAGYSVSVFTPEISGTAGCYRLDISGLAGGHSGSDIDKGHANAILLAMGFLSTVDGLRISSIDGGTVRNAIPSSCSAVFSCDPDFDIEKALADYSAEVSKGYSLTDPDMAIALTAVGTGTVWTEGDSSGFVGAVLGLPNGVILRTENGVITSCNVGVIVSDGESISLQVMPRSAYDASVTELLGDITDTMDGIGAETSTDIITRGWLEKSTNALIERTSAVMADIYGTAPSITVTHGGLECGVFKGLMNTLQVISIGLNVDGAHTTSETTYIGSLDRLYAVVCEVMVSEDI